jgi:hypothetical protein
VTGNQTDTVSAGPGKALFDRLTCPREFRLFTRAEGAEGHCEGMAPIIFWTAAFDWLDHLLTRTNAQLQRRVYLTNGVSGVHG